MRDETVPFIHLAKHSSSVLKYSFFTFTVFIYFIRLLFCLNVFPFFMCLPSDSIWTVFCCNVKFYFHFRFTSLFVSFHIPSIWYIGYFTIAVWRVFHYQFITSNPMNRTVCRRENTLISISCIRTYFIFSKLPMFLVYSKCVYGYLSLCLWPPSDAIIREQAG
jgi:hypothetical protein